MNRRDTISVVALIEGYTVHGAIKPIVEFCREAKRSNVAPRIDMTLIGYVRGADRNSLMQALEEEQIPFHPVQERFRFDREVIPQLREHISRLQPDVIWSNSVKSHFLVGLAGLNRGRQWLAFHHGYTSPNMVMTLYNQLDRWSLRQADQVVTVCKPFARQLADRGVNEARIHVQHTPIRPPEPASAASVAEMREKLGIRADDRVVLTVGRLSKEKGHKELLEAFGSVKKRYPDPRVRLLVAGDGPELAALQVQRKNLGIEPDVVLAGYQSQVWPLYQMAELFVLPSHSEGSPNVLLEAVAAGTPVIAAAVGGIPEMVVDRNEALLVPKMAVGALADALHELLTNRTLASELSATARRILPTHSPEQYYRDLSKVIGQLAGTAVSR